MTNSTRSNHLTNIVSRQQKSGVRDLMFAAFVVLATIIGVSSVGTSVAAATTHAVAQK